MSDELPEVLPAPHPGGRPEIPIDWESFDKLCALQCTEEEIASFFKCSIDTICRRCHEKHGVSFAEYRGQKSGEGKISLRRIQYQTATGTPARPPVYARNAQGALERDRKGNPIVLDPGAPEKAPNPTMLIWLGKQYLNQSDREDIKVESTERRHVTIQWTVKTAEGEKQVDPRSLAEGINKYLTVKPQ